MGVIIFISIIYFIALSFLIYNFFRLKKQILNKTSEIDIIREANKRHDKRIEWNKEFEKEHSTDNMKVIINKFFIENSLFYGLFIENTEKRLVKKVFTLRENVFDDRKDNLSNEIKPHLKGWEMEGKKWKTHE